MDKNMQIRAFPAPYVTLVIVPIIPCGPTDGRVVQVPCGPTPVIAGSSEFLAHL